MKGGLGLVAIATCIAACGTVHKPAPPKATAFLQHRHEMQNHPGLPFALVWLANPPEQIRELSQRYTKVLVAPVSLDYLGQGEPESWKKNLTDPADRDDAAKIAEELREQLLQAIKDDDKDLKLQVVDTPDAQTFVIEPALVELRPTQAVLNAAESAASFFLPGSQLVSAAAGVGLGAATGTISKGSIGIELRLKNDTIVLGEFADRREDPSTILPNLNDYSRYGYSRDTLQDWSVEMVQIFTTPPSQSLKPRSNFTLSLW